MNALQTMVDRRKINLLVIAPVAIALIFGLCFGLNYGISNQNTYLLGGLRLFDPSVLNKDWLVSKTTNYHPTFSYIVWALFFIDPSGWSFAIANVLTITLGGLLLYRLVGLLTKPEHRLSVFLIVIGINLLTDTHSVAGSYLFSKIFQPSTLGAIGYLLALTYFLQRRYLYSSLSLGLGGLFHANYLVLCFPLFSLAHLLMGTEKIPSRLVKQLLLPLLALLPFVPLILRAAHSADTEAAREIFFTIRAPHHYIPLHFYREFVPFVGWQMLGLAGWRPLALRKEIKTPLRALLIALLLLVWGATLLTTLVYVSPVAQLYFWRLAPFCDILLQLVACAGALQFLAEPTLQRRLAKISVLLVLGGFVVISGFYLHYRKYPLPMILLLMLAGLLVVRVNAFRRLAGEQKIRLVLYLSLLIYVMGAIIPIKDFRQRSSLIRGLPKKEMELYNWARKTPIDSIFLIPPGLENFRLQARRAIVADWKSPPILATEMLEWYNRMETISGIPQVQSGQQASEGYARMDRLRLARVREKYGIDYAVFRKIPELGLLNGQKIVFDNGTFVVISTEARR